MIAAALYGFGAGILSVLLVATAIVEMQEAPDEQARAGITRLATGVIPLAVMLWPLVVLFVLVLHLATKREP